MNNPELVAPVIVIASGLVYCLLCHLLGDK
jgi:hypothetical protein